MNILHATNKKIKNATKFTYDEIEFKSKLEVECFIILKKAGFDPQYEKLKFTIQDSFYPKSGYFKVNKAKKGTASKDELVRQTGKILPITYTPDISFVWEGVTVLIELKGFENDVYPLKQKIFRKWLDSQPEEYVFFEIKNKTQMNNLIKMLNNKIESLLS